MFVASIYRGPSGNTGSCEEWEQVFEHRPRTMPEELRLAQFSHHFFVLSMSLLHTESLDHLAFNPWGLRKGLNNNKNTKIFDLSRNSWDFSSCFASF